MAEYVIAQETAALDEYLGQAVEERLTVHRAEMLPAVRVLRLLRYPDQRAIIWRDKPVENHPLPFGAVARLRILRRAAEHERDRLILDRDYAASVRRCALAAMGETGRADFERRIIALQLAGKPGRTRSTMILTEHGREAEPMRGIPDRARKIAERRLRRRWYDLDAAMDALHEARSAATSLTGPLANTDGGSRGGRMSDRTAKAAERVIEAERRVERLLAWRAVFDKVDADYPPDETAGIILRRYLSDVKADGRDRGGPSMTLRDIEREQGLSRSTVNLYRDAIIDRVAWYAAEAGLIREDDT